MKNRAAAVILLSVLLSMLNVYPLIGQKTRVSVFIPFENTIKLSKFKKICIDRYEFNIPESASDVPLDFVRVFLEDQLPKTFRRDVDYRDITLLNWDKLPKNLFKEQKASKKADKNKSVKKNKPKKPDVIVSLPKIEGHDKSLLISMKFKLEVKKRNSISEEKNKFGDKVRSYVKKRFWNLQTRIILVDTENGKLIKTFKMNENVEEEKGTDPHYNIKLLFDRTMDKFLRKVFRKGKFDFRYLLTINPSVSKTLNKVG